MHKKVISAQNYSINIGLWDCFQCST